MSRRTLRAWQPDPAYKLDVIGVSGEGKSFLRSIFLSPIRRVTLANPLNDYNLGGETITTDEYSKRINEMRRGTLRVTVRPSTYEPIAMLEEFDALCSYVWEVGAMHFAIEEPSLYRGPDALRLPGNLNRIAAAGRHRAVSHSVYAQRFHQVPPIVRGQATEIYAFRQSDPMDVSDFEDRIHPDVSPIPINQLPERHFIHWSPIHGADYCAPLSPDGRIQIIVNNRWRSREDEGGL